LVTRHPTRGTPLRSLVSASKDGLLKVWDLEKQQCVGTFGDAAITKINDFVLIAELSLLVAAGTDNKLVIFIVESNEQVSLKLNSTTFVKDSNHRAIQLHYDRKRQVLMVLSADNKMEAFSVNVDKPESILRKLQRQTKKSLKRTHSEANEEPKCDKEELQSKIAHKDYDLAIHFRKSAVWVVDAVNKARSFAILPGKNFDCVVAFHNNRCVHYELKLEQTDNLKHLATIGEMQTHQMAIRGVAVSPNDALFATHSMDCIKVWTVDLFESNQSGELTIQCR
jgi:WD40 repeat protein